MDYATFNFSDAALMNRRTLLEQLVTIRSLKGSENGESRDVVVKDIVAKGGMTRNKEELAALSTEFLLTVLLDVFLLRLLDEGEEGRATVPLTVSSEQQLVVMDAAATAASAKKRKKAAAKKKRNKRNKAAAKHKKTKLMSWLGSEIVVSLIMMAAFSSIMTLIVTFSLIHPSD